jgi:hypothetical protein
MREKVKEDVLLEKYVLKTTKSQLRITTQIEWQHLLDTTGDDDVSCELIEEILKLDLPEIEESGEFSFGDSFGDMFF